MKKKISSGDAALDSQFDYQAHAPSRDLTIYMAGDYDDAKRVSKLFAFNHKNVCCSITKREYIYCGGYEEGFEIKLINYARRPHRRITHRELGSELAMTLCEELNQLSFTLDFEGQSYYVSRHKD